MRRFLFIIIIIAAILAGAYYLGQYRLHKKEHPKTLTLYGNVDVRQVDLGFRVSGRVQTMPFQEGDFVAAGIFMGALDKRPYEDQRAQAAAHVEALQAALTNAKLILERREQLKGTLAVSWEDYENARTSKEGAQANLIEAEAALALTITNLVDTEIFAPSDGSILTRIREPGTIVREADPIYTLSLNSPIWVRAFVTEPQLGLIYFGMPAEVWTDSKRMYHGHIGFISPVAEFTPKTVETTQLRTDLVYRLRIITDNPDRFLLQGMPVTVKLHLDANTQGSEK
ncbi:MAG: efflux RND transporter periplasmic adaptor subunit [Chlamydiales bacterium]